MSKFALITGSGRGLGSAIARHLAASGHTVGLHYYQSDQGAERTRHSIESEGGKAQLFQADLCQEQEAQRLAEDIKKAFGGLDVLVNNAGAYHAKTLDNITGQEWSEGLCVNVSTVFFATRAFLPMLRKSERGRIINIGDSSCDRPTARDLAISYHVGKTGALMLTRSFAAAEAKNGVTVNMVSPGYLENSVDRPDRSTVPAGRFGSFEDICAAIEFLVSPKADYLTGSNLVLSGGWNLR
jgi:3-oxoacyl-[acyl-carrier protein] reductase